MFHWIKFAISTNKDMSISGGKYNTKFVFNKSFAFYNSLRFLRNRDPILEHRGM